MALRAKAGAITKKELFAALHSLGHNMTDKEFEAMFKEFDTDGSGEVDFVEFRAMLARTKAYSAFGDLSSMCDADLERLFKTIDTDQSGLLGKKEVAMALHQQD